MFIILSCIRNNQRKHRASKIYHIPLSIMEETILSSTWREFGPDTAYVVCISVSFGFPYMISISLGFPYMVMLDTFKRKHHCSGCGVAMGCHGRCIVPGLAFVTSQCYGTYWDTEYARTWAEHLSTPWQREFTVITGALSIDWFWETSMRFFYIFLLNNSIYIIGRNCRFGTIFQVLLGPSALGHLFELVAWPRCHARRGKHFFVKSLDLQFQSAPSRCCNTSGCLLDQIA